MGVCDRDRGPLRTHCTSLRDSAAAGALVHDGDPVRLGLGAVYSLGRGVWALWEYVHQGRCRGEWWHHAHEERRLDRSHLYAVVVCHCGAGHHWVLVLEEGREELAYGQGDAVSLDGRLELS